MVGLSAHHSSVQLGVIVHNDERAVAVIKSCATAQNLVHLSQLSIHHALPSARDHLHYSSTVARAVSNPEEANVRGLTNLAAVAAAVEGQKAWDVGSSNGSVVGVF
jgi:hypothetical protein